MQRVYGSETREGKQKEDATYSLVLARKADGDSRQQAKEFVLSSTETQIIVCKIYEHLCNALYILNSIFEEFT